MAAYVSHDTGAASRSVTVAAGTDRLLVAVAFSSAATGARSATYNGVAMSVATTANQWVQIFYMLSPPVGSATLAVTGANISTVLAAHYTGIGSFQAAQQATGVASASFSPNAGGLIVYGQSAGSTSHTAVASTNERHDSGGDWYGDRIVASSGSVTVGTTSATDPDYAGAIFLDSVGVSGAINAPKATSAGSAEPITDVSVSGAVTAPVPTVSASLGIVVSASGAVTAPVATSAGTAAYPTVSVSGAVTVSLPTVGGGILELLVPAPGVLGGARGSVTIVSPSVRVRTPRARGSVE